MPASRHGVGSVFLLVMGKKKPSLEDKELLKPVHERVERLRKVAVTEANKRERLPQPLFWSLLTNELRAIRRQKRLIRVVEEIFGG